MLQQICLRISAAIHAVISVETEVKDNAISDPVSYFGSIYRMQSAALGIVAGCDAYPDSLFVKERERCNPREQQAMEDFGLWLEEQAFGKVGLSDLYESMLLLEFPVRNGVIVQETDYISSVGSFYTPNALADKMVELTLNDHILRNTGIERFSTSSPSAHQSQRVKELLMHSSFADLACGTGSFFLAVIRYFKDRLEADQRSLRHLVHNFHAIEADALSLEIAKLRVLEAIGAPELYTDLNMKFVHGNPLIGPNDEYSDYRFGHLSYYHKQLTIEPERVPKCDVMLGNPPWGNVGFDLAEQFHLLCPDLVQMEDETALHMALDRLSATHPKLYEWLQMHDDAVDLAMEDLYDDSRFDHSYSGGLQTNALFTQLYDGLCKPNGTIGLLLHGSTLTDPRFKRLWNHLSGQKRIVARYDLVNSNRIFNIDGSEEFSVLIMGRPTAIESVHLKGLTHISEMK